MVHNVPLPWDSTNRAMIVSTSDKGDPARINLRILSTDSFPMACLLPGEVNSRCGWFFITSSQTASRGGPSLTARTGTTATLNR